MTDHPPLVSAGGGTCGTGRKARACAPRVSPLEARTLPASTLSAADLVAIPADSLTLEPGAAAAGSVAPGGSQVYQVVIPAEEAGRFTATLDASVDARLSLLDDQGRTLAQSDGGPAGAGDASIDEQVFTGTVYLEVQGLGPSGTYELTTDLTPANPPFAPLSVGAPVLLAKMSGNPSPDLVTPSGIYPEVGDGTFGNAIPGSTVSDDPSLTTEALVAGEFTGSGANDLAIAESSNFDSSQDVALLVNNGQGVLTRTGSINIDVANNPQTLVAADFGNGRTDLAVANPGDGTVNLYSIDAAGQFHLWSQIPYAGTEPSALAVGDFNGDGRLDLAVVDGGDPAGQGAGVEVFLNEGQGVFTRSETIPLDGGPTAIVAADFGNGQTDLAVAESGSNAVAVFLGRGDGTFNPPATYPVGADPSAMLAGDLGNDGRISLAVANTGSANVFVLLGNGDGTFQGQVQTDVGGTPGSLAMADLNDDGRADLVVGDLTYGDATVLLGRGDGSFQGPTPNRVGATPYAPIVGDFNRDGREDVVTANLGSDDVSVLLGNGDGTLQPALSFPAGDGPIALADGDFNGDGRLDLAVADAGDPNTGADPGVSVLLGNGDGTFQSRVFIPLGGHPTAIAAGDFGNGQTDLAVAVITDGTTPNGIDILMNDGFGRFSVTSFVTISSNPALSLLGLVTGDFGNGQTDLALADYTDDMILTFLGQGNGQFVAQAPIALDEDDGAIENTPVGVVAGRFIDGQTDLAVACQTYDTTNPDADPGSVFILVSNGQSGFQLGATIPVNLNLGMNPIARGQFLGSGTTDLAVVGQNPDDGSQDVAVLAGNGRGGFTAASPTSQGTTDSPFGLISGDFNGDGLSDLAMILQSPNDVSIDLNLGDGQFADPGAVVDTSPDPPVVADLDDNKISDVIILEGDGSILFRRGDLAQPSGFDPPSLVNSGDPSRGFTVVRDGPRWVLVSVDATRDALSLFAYQNGGLHDQASLPTGPDPAQVISADLNGDGQDDLVVRNAGDGSLSLYISNGQGGFDQPVRISVGPGISDVAAARLTPNGPVDLLLTDQLTGQVEVLINQGRGTFSAPVVYRAGDGLSEVADDGDTTSVLSREGTVGVVAGSFTPGGPIDLVTLNPGSETLGLLTGLGNNQLANPTMVPTPGPVTSAAVVDFDDGTTPELALIGPNGVTILKSNGQGGFIALGTIFVNDPTGIAVAHLDGSALPDLIVGNSYGDMLILRGQTDGTFQQAVATDQDQLLAVGTIAGSSQPLLVFADPSHDNVVVEDGQGTQAVVNPSSILLQPGAVQLADLNGGNVPDLIVANSGGNNVLVYPFDEATGGFGSELNGGKGFDVGTDPVSITVANLTGRPDLIIADKGSNRVSILLNESQAGDGFTFLPGPQLNVGQGPVSTAVLPASGGLSDLLVSDSVSKDVRLLSGRGGANFDDQDPLLFPLTGSPGEITLGQFGPGGTSAAVLIPNENAVVLFSDLTDETPTSRSYSSGGIDPVSALAVPRTDGFDDLVIANNGDGLVTLLAGGPGALSFDEAGSLAITSPTSLARAFFLGDDLEVYAATEGGETPVLLLLTLGSSSNTGPPAIGLTLLPLGESSLPLVATLLTTGTNSSLDLDQSGELDADAPTATVSVGQSLPSSGNDWSSDEDLDVFGPQGDGTVVIQTGDENPGASPWTRDVLGLDEGFEQIHRAREGRRPSGAPAEKGALTTPPPSGPSARRPQAHQHQETGGTGMIDAAIEALGSEPRRPGPIPIPIPSRRPAGFDDDLSEHPAPPDGPVHDLLSMALLAVLLARPHQDRPVARPQEEADPDSRPE